MARAESVVKVQFDTMDRRLLERAVKALEEFHGPYIPQRIPLSQTTFKDTTMPDFTNASVGEDEIVNRFGFHKGTIEGPNATAPRHSDLRKDFMQFAVLLDEVLPDGRAKHLAFTELEAASMWAHKAIAEQAPISND